MKSTNKCPKCNGLGYTEKTAYGQIRCSYCAGNGWNPIDNFRFGKHPPLQSCVECACTQLHQPCEACENYVL